MEKVRFEAFNVEELRVLRRACYEAGAAFGDPGHTAAERETLDDLAVEILGELKKKEAAARPAEAGRTAGKDRGKGCGGFREGRGGQAAFCIESFPEPCTAEGTRCAATGHSRKGTKPTPPAESARSGKVYRFLVCALREVRPGTRILRKNAHFFVLLPGVRRENGAQKYAPGQDLVRVRQRLPLSIRTSRMPRLICLA